MKFIVSVAELNAVKIINAMLIIDPTEEVAELHVRA
jgi:hypothetical protein